MLNWVLLRPAWSRVGGTSGTSEKGKKKTQRNPKMQNKGSSVLHRSQGGACVGGGCQTEALLKKSI